MAEHTLPDGKAMIGSLLALGDTLGYAAEPEYDVAAEGEAPAPVDVAWLGWRGAGYPLFIFEVESVAGANMVQNAQKVFSQASDDFEKPIFHFHLVMKGGAGSGRTAGNERTYGTYNYRIYLIAEAGQPTALLGDIFDQHQKVSRGLEIAPLAAVLDQEHFPDLDVEALWDQIEGLDFETRWASEYAHLALAEPRFAARLGRYLGGEFEGDGELDADHYETAIGAYCGPLLNAVLAASQDAEMAGRCLERLQEWQGSGGVARLAPRYGLSIDNDNLIFSLMPAIWAQVVATLGSVEGARRWAAEQLRQILEAARGERALGALSALWLLHVSAPKGDLAEYFEAARTFLNEGGGVPEAMLTAPPLRGGPVNDLGEWWEALGADAQPVPEREQFTEALGQSEAFDASALSNLAIRTLLEDAIEPEAGVLRTALRS